jgi:hypothetical protein
VAEGLACPICRETYTTLLPSAVRIEANTWRKIVRYTQRNVERWRDGDMRKRWTAAGMLVAEQQFRRIIGYGNLAKLVIAIERHTPLAAEKNHQPGAPAARYRVSVNP